MLATSHLLQQIYVNPLLNTRISLIHRLLGGFPQLCQDCNQSLMDIYPRPIITSRELITKQLRMAKSFSDRGALFFKRIRSLFCQCTIVVIWIISQVTINTVFLNLQTIYTRKQLQFCNVILNMPRLRLCQASLRVVIGSGRVIRHLLRPAAIRSKLRAQVTECTL